tara:strand:- start:187 stop:501 length:315 start_codon:yes stop_codon:yes gene_type:complete
MMISLLLLQSFATLADVHQFHQADNQHQIITEQLQDNDQLKLSEKQSNTDIGCQHCCHCHGSIHFALPTNAEPPWPNRVGSEVTAYSHFYSPDISAHHYRPPII